MNVEGQLILEIVEQILSGRKSKETESLGNTYKINWQRFTELISHHELIPFTYQVIKDFTFLPHSDLRKFLEYGYYRNLTNSIYLWQEFLRIFEAFEHEGVGLLPIKGVSFLEDIYSKNYFRSMADIDILVKEANLKNAEKIFNNLGYIKDLGGLKEEYWRKKQIHITFRLQRPGQFLFLVDMHWALDFKRKNIQILPKLWDRIRETRVEGRKIKLLSPEDALFSLALHKRRFGKALCLKYGIDIVLLLRKYASKFDWDYVLKEAKQGKICSSLFFVLSEAGMLYDKCIPSSILKKIRIPTWKKKLIENYIEKNVFSDSTRLKLKNLYLKSHFLLYDNFREPIGYILNIPQEQFAKFYGLKAYDKKTRFFFKIRFPYILYKAIFNYKYS